MSAKDGMVLEGRLRPPIELWSTAVAWGCALVAIVAPWALMMPPMLGWVVALIAGCFGWKRCSEALVVIRYQHGLKYYPLTKIAPHKIPVKPDEFYLGEGFEWTQLHTQRLRDARQPEVEKFVKPGPQELALRRTGERLDQWCKK